MTFFQGFFQHTILWLLFHEMTLYVLQYPFSWLLIHFFQRTFYHEIFRHNILWLFFITWLYIIRCLFHYFWWFFSTHFREICQHTILRLLFHDITIYIIDLNDDEIFHDFSWLFFYIQNNEIFITFDDFFFH